MKNLKRNAELPDFKLMPIDEAAKVIGMSHWTLRDWISRGTITSIKISNRVFIPSTEIARLIAEGTRPAIGAAAGGHEAA